MAIIPHLYSYDDATALVTTGSGKYYSTGLDLEELNSLSPTDKIEFFFQFQKLMNRMLTFPLVSVAAINGRHIIDAVILLPLG